MNDKMTKQFYHRDSIIRNSKLSAMFLDLLYNLNVLDFEFNGKESLDDGWPVLPLKSFTASTTSSPRRRSKQFDDTMSVRSFSTTTSRNNTSFDTLSLAQSLVSDEGSIDRSINSSFDLLRSEREVIEEEKVALYWWCEMAHSATAKPQKG